MKHDLEFRMLRIGDFKSFVGSHELSLCPKPGLYYFTGRNLVEPELGANGVGKSTLLTDAIFWVCWNKTIRDSRPGEAVEPWNGAAAQTYVELDFIRNGKPHTLARTRRPNKFTLDDHIIDQKDVPGILGMTEETFRRTLVLGQFGSLFLDMQPEQQSAMFSQALELDRWLRAAKRAATNRDEAETTLDAIMHDVAAQEARKAELTEQLADAKTKAGEWNEDHLLNMDRAEGDLKQALKVLMALDAQPVVQSQTAEKLKDRLVAKKDDLAAAERLVRMLNTKVGASQNAVEAHRRDLTRADQAVTRLEDAQKDKLCPTCGQKVTGKHLADELKTAKAEVKKLTNELFGLHDKVRDAKDDLTKAEIICVDLQKIVDALASDVATAEVGYTDWLGKRELCKQAMVNAKEALDRVRNETNPHDDTITRVRDRKAKVGEDIGKLLDERDALQKEHGGFDYWATAFKEIRLNLIDAVLKELEIASNTHAERLGLVDWEVRFDTERETKKGDISKGFSVFLYPPGQKDAVPWESYSGGESQRLQLAVSFALSEVLLSHAGLTSNIEVLDEPTRHLSDEGVVDLLECLQQRAKDQGKAIFFVDHSSLDRGNFDGTYVVTKTKDGSHVEH